MFENEYHISKLIARHLREELNAAEQAELDSWVNASADNKDLFHEFSADQQFFDNINVFRSADKHSVWQKTMKKIGDEQFLKVIPAKRISFMASYKYVAVAACIMLISGIFIYLNTNHFTKNKVSYTTDIPPGKNTATLTLADGEKIVLSDAMDGEIANKSGVSISKTSDGQLVYKLTDVKKDGKINYNTLSTARGEQYQVILPDGSKVWLNAASSIVFPDRFTSLKERKVKLLGEAYFEVSENKNQPFCVESDHQKVEVLGTHFNINCYQDEAHTKTTLLEGRIQINGTTILKPNEQAIVEGNKINVIPVMAATFIDWKEGAFAFKSENLNSIMRKISRWYDVEIVYQLSKSNYQTYTGNISRSDHISKVLHVLSEIGGLNFEIEGKRIIVNN